MLNFLLHGLYNDIDLRLALWGIRMDQIQWQWRIGTPKTGREGATLSANLSCKLRENKTAYRPFDDRIPLSSQGGVVLPGGEG